MYCQPNALKTFFSLALTYTLERIRRRRLIHTRRSISRCSRVRVCCTHQYAHFADAKRWIFVLPGTELSTALAVSWSSSMSSMSLMARSNEQKV
jgi:hypothetical protein